ARHPPEKMNSAARARGSGTGAPLQGEPWDRAVGVGHSCCLRGDGDLVAHPLQAIDQVLFGAPIASLVEVASAKVLERLAGAENVEDRNGDLVCDCTRGAPRSNASSHA